MRNAPKGGTYGEVRAGNQGSEVHHLPADSASTLSRNEGPAIHMDAGDHRKTASWGSSKDAKAYREQQKKLIEDGKFGEAQQMDVDDLKNKFGDKYDEHVKEMQDKTGGGS